MEETKMGRPTLMTTECIAKLEVAFLTGASDKEACFIAGIGASTLYDYCRDNPDFSERKESLKDMVKYQARANIAKSINNGSEDLSKWYLERKVKDEFSLRNELTGKDGKDLVSVNQEIKEKSDLAINEFLNDKGNIN